MLLFWESIGYYMQLAMEKIMSTLIKKLRVDLDLSQKELADLIGIKQSTLSNYETGKRNPSLRICYRFIKLCKIREIYITLEELRPE